MRNDDLHVVHARAAGLDVHKLLSANTHLVVADGNSCQISSSAGASAPRFEINSLSWAKATFRNLIVMVFVV